LTPKDSIDAILEALTSQQQQGETSLIVRIEPDLIEDAVNALRGYRTLFAPLIPGLTDTAPIYAIYEQMRQDHETEHTILLFVECQTIGEFREALDRLPRLEFLRRAQEFWRRADSGTERGLADR
jgi:hypothetical protein